jgi:hypothetical protein
VLRSGTTPCCQEELVTRPRSTSAGELICTSDAFASSKLIKRRRPSGNFVQDPQVAIDVDPTGILARF